MKKRTLTVILALCLTLALATQALAVAEVEPNDSAAAAQTITIGDSISGEIKEGGDEDFYAFTLTESGKVSLDVRAYMAYYSLRLFDEESTELWHTDQRRWNEEVGFRHDEYDVYLAAGTYYLQVKGSYYASGESNAPGSYTIKTEFTSANVTESEPNDSVAKANKVNVGSVIRGVIATGNVDTDFYAFTLTESGKVSLDVTAYMAYYSLRLFDEDGTELWHTDQRRWNEEVGFRHDEYDVYLATGTYYLQVKGSYYASGESNAPGSYIIKTEFTSADVTELEPNDSVAKANKVTVGSVIRGVVATGNVDTDFYAFTLTESGKVSLNVTAHMAYYSLRLFDEEGTELWYTDQRRWNEETGFRNDEYDVHLAAGTYCLQVKGSYYASGESNASGSYTIKLGDIVHVSGVTMQPTSLSLDPGQTAALSATVSPSNATERAIVWSSSNSNVATVNQNGMVTVIAEGTATITATTADGGFTAKCVVTSPKPAISFTDIPADSPYASAVAWAVEKGVTNGTSVNTFSPDATCTRGQIITFLWRAAGQPKPLITNIDFDDVSPDAYYANAVLWAVEMGITNGTSANTFSPDATCNRGQIITFLWRAAGQPEPTSTGIKFDDVSPEMFYAKAIGWAAQQNVAAGKTETTFAPLDNCPRGDSVLFLYNYFVNK